MERISTTGRIGDIVVLDHVSVSENGPMVEFDQPAFFRITDTVGDRERWNTFSYKLIHLKSEKTIERYAGTYLSYLEVWKDWKLNKLEGEIASQKQTISLLQRDRELLMAVLGNVTIVTTEAIVESYKEG